MPGGTKIGTMFAEITLDSSKYDAGLKDALASSKSVSIDVEKAWKTMGTRSTATVDKMRANVINSYELIRNKSTSTAEDIARAEIQAKAKLERINNTYYREQIKHIKELEEQTRRSNETVTAGFAKAGQAVIAMGAAIAATGAIAAKAIVEQGMAFESTMKAVQAISSGSASSVEELSENLDKLTKSARESGASTEWSAQQSGEALKYMAMTGMSVADQITALPGLLDLATAAQMDLALASDIVTDSLTAFGMATSEIGRFNDALINTTTRANTTVEMLGESLKYVAPVAANMGYSIEETSALLGVLANSGIKAEQAGTSLRQSLLRTGGAAKSMGMDINSSLIDVLEEMHKRQYTVNEVVEEFGLIASTGAVVLMNNVDSYRKLTKELETNEGATQKLSTMMRDTLKVDFDILKSTISDVALELYDMYDDKLRVMVTNITDAIRNNKNEIMAIAEAASGTIEVMFKLLNLSAKVAKASIFGKETESFNSFAAFDVSSPKDNISEYEKMVEEIKKAESALSDYNLKLLKTQEKLNAALSDPSSSSKLISAYETQARVLETKIKETNATIDEIELKLGFNPTELDNALKDSFDFLAEYEVDKQLKGFFDDIDSAIIAAKTKTDSASIEKMKVAAEAYAKRIKVLGDAWAKGATSEEFYKYELARLKELEDGFIKSTGDKATAHKLYLIELEKLNDEYHKADVNALKKSNEEIENALDDAFAGIDKLSKQYSKSLSDHIKEVDKQLKDFFADIDSEAEAGFEAWGKSLNNVDAALKDFFVDIDNMPSIAERIGDLPDNIFDGQSFGNELADGINNAMLSMQSFNDMMLEHASIQEEINRLKAEADLEKDLEERAKLLDMISDKETGYIQDQMSGYRQMFSTTAQLFDENSKARETMHGIEMAFAAVEIAMNAKKAISAAVTAITTQGAGDPYTAFARVAAMIATMAGVLSMAGISFGGGGGGSSAPVKATNQTGSVLGDSGAVSESLQNSQDFLEDMHLEEYTELQGIHNEMKDLNSNITGLVSNLYRGGNGSFTAEGMGISTGWNQGSFADANDKIFDGIQESMNKLGMGFIDPLTSIVTKWAGQIGNWVVSGIFGGGKKTSVESQGITTANEASIGDLISGTIIDAIEYADLKIKKDGGWFHSDSTKYKTEIEDLDSSVDNLFTQIFLGLSESFVGIAEIVGQDLSTVQDYVFEIGKIDLKNLETADEVNEALIAAISGISDNAATDLFGELIGQYQDVGEGMLETAIRVSSEKVIVIDTLDKIGNAFSDADIPAMAIEFSQSLLDMAGGIDAFIESTATYFDKFFTDEEKHDYISKVLTENLSNIDLEVPGTRDLYRDVVEGLDMTTESGKRAFLTFMSLSETADEYYSYLEDAQDNITDGINNILISSGRLTEEDLFKNEFQSKYGVTPSTAHSTEAIDFITSANETTIRGLADFFGVTVTEMLQDIADEATWVADRIEEILGLQGSFVNDLETMAGVYDANRLGDMTTKYQTDDLSDTNNQLELLTFAANTDPEELQTWLNMLGLGVDEFYDDMGFMLDLWTSAADELVDSEEALAEARKSAHDSIEDLINQLMGGSLAPVQSMEYFQNQYDTMLANAENATTAEEITASTNALVGFTPDYLDFMGAYSGDNYNHVFDSVIGQLSALQAQNAVISEAPPIINNDVTVNVKIGDQELREIMIEVLRNDPEAAKAINRVVA